MQPETMAMVQPATSAEEAIRCELAEAVGRRRFEHWFQNHTEFKVADDELSIEVENPFLLNWIQKHFRGPLQEIAQNVLGPSARLRFEVAPQAAPISSAAAPVNTPPAATRRGAKATGQPHDKAGAPEQAKPAQPQPAAGRRFADLGDLVQGTCNELALTAARQVCQAPGTQFNPLFIHGGVGIGKTHLLEGIYRQVRRKFPALQVVYLTSEAFTNYFTEALRQHTLPSFRQRFRTVDVLLLDDVDFLDAKRVIQEEFLHTFKQLESHGRQIVIASDRHPRLLTKVSDELKTRFLSGLVCRLESPDLATRRQILERKAARMTAEFSSDALEFIAQRFPNNVRELEGALNCLQTYFCMTGKRIGISAARQILADLERDCIRVVRMTDIEQAVCNLFGVQVEELRSAKRSRSLSQPRMLAMFLARKHTRAAYSEIGQHFGGRNHSTVMSAERKIGEGIKRSESIHVASQTWQLQDVMDALEQQLRVG
jgi:chromosomal replication initiator protein